MRATELAGLMNGIAPVLLELVAPLHALIADQGARLEAAEALIGELRKRLALAEGKPSLKFRGIHDAGRDYEPSDCCTRSGSLWICTRPTRGSFDYGAWVLAVKKAR